MAAPCRSQPIMIPVVHVSPQQCFQRFMSPTPSSSKNLYQEFWIAVGPSQPAESPQPYFNGSASYGSVGCAFGSKRMLAYPGYGCQFVRRGDGNAEINPSSSLPNYENSRCLSSNVQNNQGYTYYSGDGSLKTSPTASADLNRSPSVESEKMRQTSGISRGLMTSGKKGTNPTKSFKDAGGTDIKPCSFCRSNGETRQFFESHELKNDLGVVTCPILRRYVCPVCFATGDVAHTLKYCPNNRGEMILASPMSGKRSNRNSRGIIGAYKYN